MLHNPRISLLLQIFLFLWLHELTLQTCRPEYKKVNNHIACRPRNPECRLSSSGLKDAEKKLLVDLQNRIRSMVARGALAGFPPAANMQKLVWDDSLAEVAQAHANQCLLQHTPAHMRITTRFPITGQNLVGFRSGKAWSTSSRDIDRAVRTWFDERRNYSPSILKKFTQKVDAPVGHFTQVIWASTRYIGCGAATFNMKNAPKRMTRFYVCDYASPGNIAGERVYLPGKACSRCPRGTVCEKETGLCAGGPASGRNAASSWLG